MEKDTDKNRFVWPDLVVMEFLTAIALTIVLLIWALLVNAPLMEMANPGISENPSKAPWYFVGLQELLVYFDPWIAGVMIPGIIILALIMIPYLDTNREGVARYSYSLRKFSIVNFIFGFSMWWILILAGYFLRGPDWQIYWPWESWETIKEVKEELWSLSTEAGLTGLIAYFGLGMLVPRFISRDFYRKSGLLVYVITMMLMLLMYAVPIKIFLRLVFNVRYILATPWFNI